MQITKDDLWAKLEPFESVESHLLRTGLVCKVACTKTSLKSVFKVLQENTFGIDDENLLNFVCYIIAMHDIGKVHPSFQEKDKDFCNKLKEENLYNPIIDNFRHEAQSQEYIYNLIDIHNINMTDDVLDSVAYIIGNHHYKNGNAGIIYNAMDKWMNFIYEIDEVIFNKYPFSISNNFKILNADIFFYYFFGLLIICDWLASGDVLRDVDFYNNDEDVILNKLIFLGFGEYNVDWKDVDYNVLLNTYDLRPIQKWTVENKNKLNSNLMIIEAGTGFGKTSMSLFSAFQFLNPNNGFYYALPMQTMVNSKYMELKKVCDYKKIPLTLLHANRELFDEINNIDYYNKENGEVIEVSHYLTSSLRRGLFNQYIVGTIDQLLSSILPNKFSVLKLIGLAGKVLILDEVHMCDTYMTGLLEKLLSWCKALNIRVIILSATLSMELKEKYINAYSNNNIKLMNTSYPLITLLNDDKVEEIFIEDNTKNKCLSLSVLNILNDLKSQSLKIKDIYDSENNIIVYKNTVLEAQKLYEECKSIGIDNIILIHSRFTLKDRQNKEKLIMNLFGKDISMRPNKYLVISTQVLEASLDLDFDVCFTDLCPFDILAQRVGRQCRFDVGLSSKNRGNLFVFSDDNMDFSDSEYVYPKLFLLNTLFFINNKSILEFPNILRDGIENIYVLNKEISNSDIYYNDKKVLDSIKMNSAIVSSINKPNSKHFTLLNKDVYNLNKEEYEYFKTRLGESSSQILCLNKQFEFSNLDFGNISFKQYKELMKYSFSILTSVLDLNNLNIKYINKGYLKGKYILLFENNFLDININKCYYYDNDIGFKIIKKI